MNEEEVTEEKHHYSPENFKVTTIKVQKTEPVATKEQLLPQTKWEFYTFNQLAEIAEEDDVNVTDFDSLKAYLDSRSNELEYKYLGNDQFDVLFA